MTKVYHSNGAIAAMKYVRKITALGLKDAKALVDKVAVKHGLVNKKSPTGYLSLILGTLGASWYVVQTLVWA